MCVLDKGPKCSHNAIKYLNKNSGLIFLCRQLETLANCCDSPYHRKKMLPAKLNCILNFALPYSCDHVTCVYKLACNCYSRAFDKATYRGTASLQVLTPISKQKRPPFGVVTLQFLIHAKSTRTFTTQHPPRRQWL